MMKKPLLAGALLSSLLFSACTTTVTNLTPSTQLRSTNSFYPFEVALDTRDRCIKRETIRPYVLVGTQVYPMRPALMIDNRWETLVEIPGDKEYVSYRYKFDYDTRSIPEPKPGSRLSRPFQLQILDSH